MENNILKQQVRNSMAVVAVAPEKPKAAVIG
jgi:hypothetical protein